MLLKHLTLVDPWLSMCNFENIFLMLLLSFLYVVGSCYCLHNKSGKIEPTNHNFENLKICLEVGGIEENIIFQNNATEYDELNFQWNKWNGNIRPVAYFIPKTVADVRSAVICCRSLNIRIVARSGGHSFVKNSFGDSNSVVIDLSKLNQISLNFDQMHCEVGAGTRTSLISYTLWKEAELMTPLGICPTVGIAGLALGGGFGYFSRVFGLTSDNLLEMEMVDAKGNILLINNTTNTDLFWALRGGGGGSYGIVTKFKLKMYPIPKSIVLGKYTFKMEDFHQFFSAYQSLVSSSIPNQFGVLVELVTGTIKIIVTWISFGNKKTTKSDIEDLLFSFDFPPAILTSVDLLTYSDFMVTIAQEYSQTKLRNPSDIPEIDKHLNIGWLQCKSMFVNKILNKGEIAKLEVLLQAFVKSSVVYFEHNGGAIDDFSRSETAFVHRKHLYSVQLSTFFTKRELTAISAMNSLYETCQSIFNHTESYQNYLDSDCTDYLDRYYGENIERLIKVKLETDPQNVFYHSHSIPTTIQSLIKLM